MISESREAFIEALRSTHGGTGGHEAEADLDAGATPWAHHSGDLEPQRLSDGAVGLKHTQLTIYEKEVDSPAAPLLVPPMPCKIKGLN